MLITNNYLLLKHILKHLGQTRRGCDKSHFLKGKLYLRVRHEIASLSLAMTYKSSHCEERSDEAIFLNLWHSLRTSAAHLGWMPYVLYSMNGDRSVICHYTYADVVVVGIRPRMPTT